MQRREFMGIMGGTAVLLPACARAQQAKSSTIGVLVLGNPPPEIFLETLRDGLRSRGYVEGETVKLEVRSADRSRRRARLLRRPLS